MTKPSVCVRCGNENNGYWKDLCICCVYDIANPANPEVSCNIKNCKNCGGPEARKIKEDPKNFSCTYGYDKDHAVYLWRRKSDGKLFMTRSHNTIQVPEYFSELLGGHSKVRLYIESKLL